MGSSGEPGRCEHGKLYAEFCWDCVDRSAALGSSGSGEALSEARLAEIREQVDEYARKVYKQADVEFGYGLHELLAEVERQRTALAAATAREAAREAALVAALPFLREVAKAHISMLDDDDVIIKVAPGRAAWVLSRCRHFLRQLGQEGGGDGA